MTQRALSRPAFVATAWPGRKSVGIFLCAKLLALGENHWTASAVNRPVNPTAAEQHVVGYIDNCIDVLFGDVALQESDLHYLDLMPRQSRQHLR
jgi:hypothetical protein